MKRVQLAYGIVFLAGIAFGTAFLMSCGGGGGSGVVAHGVPLWSEAGSDIYFDSGIVGIGTATPSGVPFPETNDEVLDVAGQMAISGNGNGEAIAFRNSGYILGDGVSFFRLSLNNSRIFEVAGTTNFFFDNVDVYPDDTDAQQLGRSGNRWSDVYAVRGDFSGDVTANAFNMPSDARFKTEMRPVDDAVGRLARIRGMRYVLRQADFPERGFDSRQRLGVTAQDVEAVFPELVKTDEDGYKSVDYAGLTPVLIEAVKQQQRTIDKQEGRLCAQQARIEALTKLTASLAARLDALAGSSK